MKEPICCPPKVDTFLAKTPVKPMGPEKPRKTLKQLQAIGKEITDALNEPMPNNFFDDIELKTKTTENPKIKSFSL